MSAASPPAPDVGDARKPARRSGSAHPRRSATADGLPTATAGTKYEVAQWMVDQIHARGRAEGAALAHEAAETFGDEWVIRAGDHARFTDSVLGAFRRVHAGSVRWERHGWESVRRSVHEGA